MLAEIPRASKYFPLSVDPTFNFGAYEVTPVTYRNMLFECKSRNMRNVWVPATMIGPVIIQHDKSTPSYDTALSCIAKKLGIEREDLCITTDGKQALIDTCSTCFKNSTMLRCRRQFEANCREFLKKIGVPSSAEEIMIDIVFGESGLIEAQDKKNLKEKLKESIVLERESTNLEEGDGKGKLAVYIVDREKTVLRKLIRSVRRKAFRTPESTTPPRLYTNQSETVNSILSAKKAALGYKKKEDISKFDFIKKVLQPSIGHQRREIERALIGQSNEYRLNKKAEYLQIPLETWTNLSMAQKRKYLDFIINLSNDELESMKTIDDSFWNMEEQRIHPIKTALSVKLSEAVNILHADTIEKKALDLLNYPNAITLSPTLTENDKRKTYLVAGKSSKETYNVSV